MRCAPTWRPAFLHSLPAVAGIDHVGIGSDFDGIDFIMTGLEDVSKSPNLLARRVWADADLRKLAGESFLRVPDAADAACGAQGVSAFDRGIVDERSP